MGEEPLRSTKPGYLDPSILGRKSYPSTTGALNFEVTTEADESIAIPSYSWDQTYTSELSTLQSPRSFSHPAEEEAGEDASDNGADDTEGGSDLAVDKSSRTEGTSTVWFSDVRAQEKVVAHLRRHALAREADTSFLDLGTGNGEMLFALREAEPWRSGRRRLLGVDYAEAGVLLARRLAAQRGLTPEKADNAAAIGQQQKRGNNAGVDFMQWDILQGKLEDVLGEGAEKDGFDVVLDKGTFDAVSLSNEVEEEEEEEEKEKEEAKKGEMELGPGEHSSRRAQRAFESYPGRVARLVRPGGLVVVTSCNWTEDELAYWFIGTPHREADNMDSKPRTYHHPSPPLKLEGRIAYPRFSFGGRHGQSVCTLLFRRVEAGIGD